MSRAWGKGSTRAWRRLRAAILDLNREVNAGRCGLALDGQGGRTVYPDQVDRRRLCPRHRGPCDAGCTRYADTVHHTRGRAVTGDDPRFLMATCATCNGHVGDPSTYTTTVGDPPGRAVTRWA